MMINVMIVASARAAEDDRERPHLRPGELPDRPQVWMGAIWPGETAAQTPLAQLVAPGADWEFVKQHLDGVVFHVNRIGNPSWKYGDARLARLIEILEENHIRVAIEAMGPQPGTVPARDGGTTGADTAHAELAYLDHLYELGGKCSLLNVDRSLSTSISAGLSPDAAIHQLLEFNRVMRADHPDMHIMAIIDLPHWGWENAGSYATPPEGRYDKVMGYGDLHHILPQLISEAKRERAPLDGITIDCPHDYAKLTKVKERHDRESNNRPLIGRVREVEQLVQEQGLQFNLIVNSEAGGRKSDEEFYNDTLEYVDQYLKLGGHPNRLIIESWYDYPKQLVPESGHTMTGLAKAVIERVRR
jgi:hypothetical protein